MNSLHAGRQILIGAAALLSLGLGGCQEAPSYRAVRLAGEVTLDGVPLQQGSISFISQGGGQKGGAVGASIQAGRYDCDRVPQGELLVQFEATEPTGELDFQGVPLLRSLIPPAYREGISLEIHQSDLQRDFALTTE